MQAYCPCLLEVVPTIAECQLLQLQSSAYSWAKLFQKLASQSMTYLQDVVLLASKQLGAVNR